MKSIRGPAASWILAATMPRLFTGLEIPSETAAALLALQPSRLRDAKLVARDQLHITLQFVGGVTAARARELEAGLASVGAPPPFEVELSGVGAFPARERPKVLWAGVRPSTPLQGLRDKIGEAMASLGLQVERRAYRPHVTLARLRQTSLGDDGGLDDFFGAGCDWRSRFVAREFVLYSVEQTRAAPRYVKRASYPLGA